jgi:hypothetical protein
MTTADDDQAIDSVTRVAQIVMAALIAGALMLLGIAVMLAPLLEAGPGQGARAADAKAADQGQGIRPPSGAMDIGEILAWISVGYGVVAMVCSFFVPRLIVNRQRRRIAEGKWDATAFTARPRGAAQTAPPLESDTAKLAVIYTTQLIIGAAFLEGGAMLAAVAYLLGKQPVALSAAILLICLLVAEFPTRARVAAWLDRQMQRLMLERQSTL